MALDPFKEFVTAAYVSAAGFAVEETIEFVRGVLGDKNIGDYKSDRYMSGLVIDFDARAKTLTYKFSDPYAQKVEDGMPAYDLKPIMLGSAKVKTSPKGKQYVDVPFRLMDRAAASAVAGGAKADSRVRQVVPQSVQDFLEALSDQSGGGKVRAKKGTFPEKLKTDHKVGLYDEAIRHSSAMMQRNPGQFPSRFATVRRISLASPGSAWIIPAQPGVNVEPEARSHFQDTLLESLDTALRLWR